MTHTANDADILSGLLSTTPCSALSEEDREIMILSRVAPAIEGYEDAEARAHAAETEADELRHDRERDVDELDNLRTLYQACQVWKNTIAVGNNHESAHDTLKRAISDAIKDVG